jgi:GNAT superfamily N-acetyltransferase
VTVFLVVRHDGRPLGCGAVRSLAEPVVEIKRMYVRREARGPGVGVAILEAREREAVVAGYRQIPCFGAYAAGQVSRCFERRLAQSIEPLRSSGAAR